MEGRKNIFFSSSISQFVAKDLQNFGNRSLDDVFIAKMKFEYGFCISRGDNP